MPYCNQCGRYIGGGMLCAWCGESHQSNSTPTQPTQTMPVPDTMIPLDVPQESEETASVLGTTPSSVLSEQPVEPTALTPNETTPANENAPLTPTVEESPPTEAPSLLPHNIADAPTAPAAQPTESSTDTPRAEAPQEPSPSVQSPREETSRAGRVSAAVWQQVRQVFDTPDHTDTFSPREIRSGRMMSVLCYLWVLWIIPYTCAKNARYVRFHLRQGLTLLLTDCLGLTLGGVAALIGSVIPIAMPLFAALAELILLASLALKAWAIIGVLRGKARELLFSSHTS